MDASKIDATEVAAVVAFGGVLVSAAVAYMTASRSVYVNAITTSRIRWIENVRRLIAQVRDLCIMAAFERSRDVELDKPTAYSILQAGEELRLTLGRSTVEVNIIALVDLCSNNTSNYDLCKKYVEQLADHAQFLFNIEWKRVKREASIQIFKVKGFESRKLHMRYRNFCESDGNFPGCVTS